MRIPKLKYFYTALKPSEYEAFEQSRSLVIDRSVTVNIQTGQVHQAQPARFLYASATVADTRFRQLNLGWEATVYVLRIPASSVPKTQLTPVTVEPNAWLCSADLHIAHCGVERFELAPQEPQFEIVASSH